MNPPNEGEYPTRDALIRAVQTHSMSCGYAVTIKRSCNRDGIVILGCDCGGEYCPHYGVTDETRLRNTCTRLQGCPFTVCGKRKNDIWFLTIQNPLHNHKPIYVSSAYPIQCRIPPKVKTQVQHLTTTGVPPRQVALVVRQATSHPIIAQDVYNVQRQLWLESLAGKSPIESLVHTVTESNYFCNYRTDADRRLSHFFFAHPQSVELLNQYPIVLLLDCTYKTNHFKMPLLNIVGTTCTN